MEEWEGEGVGRGRWGGRVDLERTDGEGEGIWRGQVGRERKGVDGRGHKCVRKLLIMC